MPLDRTSKVCGTDGVTYKSVCLLEMKACMHQTPIMVAYEGGCRPLQAANQQLQNHVSQGDWGQRPHQQQGREGDSSSEESDESSEERSAGRPPTRTPFIPQTIAPTRRILYDRVTIPPQVPESSTTPYYSTMIPEGCPETCPIQDLPVCGSDGVTYGSPCLFKAQSCRPEGSGLTAVYAGACIPTCGSECEALYDPVCGTDGTTYNSVCVLDQTSCRLEDETLTVAYRGECFNTLRGKRPIQPFLR
ncbi:Kazal-type serine proteinase inhibitor 1 [Apostichopus japonicus]|uniref:Kazal-type serine proteinase inhibitor 1 n=1 Tax=Stichopus japonicus TaxID=307972 RepID=A0A2G8L552_STIJA|nr:Kazal-type serine proteinase inhibitor 1 [Apostichopus japonicus]